MYRTLFFFVRQAWRVAHKRNLVGYGGQLSDLEVKVPYTPGKHEGRAYYLGRPANLPCATGIERRRDGLEDVSKGHSSR